MHAQFQTVFHSRKVMSALLARVSCVTPTFVRQSDILSGFQMEADAGRSRLIDSRARQRLSKYIPAEANAHNNRRAVFSVANTALVAMQRRSKHIYAAVNQHATLEEALFSVGAAQKIEYEALT
jgi:hypothetical protein